MNVFNRLFNFPVQRKSIKVLSTRKVVHAYGLSLDDNETVDNTSSRNTNVIITLFPRVQALINSGNYCHTRK